MALGPGKHLKGLKLMNGLISPEEVRFSVLWPGYLTRIAHSSIPFTNSSPLRSWFAAGTEVTVTVRKFADLRPL